MPELLATGLPPELAPVAAIALAAALGTWLLSIVTGECSWVDRAWSLLPPVYVATFAYHADFGDARLNLMTALTFAWGGRLTFNFWRKGGYAKGGEDYRWEALRRRIPRPLFQVFNLVFTAGYQNLLLLLITLPAWQALRHRGSPLSVLDFAATAAFLAFLVGETAADEQQWRFHGAKKRASERGEPMERPFLDAGLFAYCRHPNFFCEQGQWWSLYLFSVAAGAPPLNVTAVGAALLTLLFHGSTNFTESLSLAKYPGYADYQRRTSRLIPWFPRD